MSDGNPVSSPRLEPATSSSLQYRWADQGEQVPDKLTGLRTHRDDLRNEMAAFGPSCCLVDIDGLIWINDQHGHEEGDRVVRVVARRIEEAVLDLPSAVFRVGGDEFLVLVRSFDRAVARDTAMTIVSDVHALAIPYRRVDRPDRTVVEVNVAILGNAPTFAERAFHEYGLTSEARDWIGQVVYHEKLRIRRTAGIVVDLQDTPGSPWG